MAALLERNEGSDVNTDERAVYVNARPSDKFADRSKHQVL